MVYEPRIDLTGFSWTNKKGETYYVTGEPTRRGLYWVCPCNVFKGKDFINTENVAYPEVLEKYTRSLEKRR